MFFPLHGLVVLSNPAKLAWASPCARPLRLICPVVRLGWKREPNEQLSERTSTTSSTLQVPGWSVYVNIYAIYGCTQPPPPWLPKQCLCYANSVIQTTAKNTPNRFCNRWEPSLKALLWAHQPGTCSPSCYQVTPPVPKVSSTTTTIIIIIHTHLPVCSPPYSASPYSKLVTFSGFTFPDEKSAPRISVRQQLPLCILTPEFPKVPAAEKTHGDE